jgi:hypothetical protein
MRIGLDKLPHRLVLVQCDRCHKAAGVYSATRGEAGSWTYKERGRGCCCAPPPVLPEGTELAEMVAAAWDEVDTRGDDDDDGRAPVRVRR